MPARRPEPRIIEGTYLRLFPLQKSDLLELFTALGTPEVFAGGWGGGPAGFRATLPELVAFGETYFSWETGNVYGARLVGGENDGALVGTSTLGDFDEALEHAHIGWTAWDPRVWASAVNPEAKLLMLGEAFGNGFGRVKLQADDRNVRSKAAIAKLGATFEGVVRRDRPRADGSWRDTAVFSILAEEWPAVRASLEARLAGFGGHPVAFAVGRTRVDLGHEREPGGA
ncbi:GNAT family protein [soil metagenome]